MSMPEISRMHLLLLLLQFDVCCTQTELPCSIALLVSAMQAVPQCGVNWQWIPDSGCCVTICTRRLDKDNHTDSWHYRRLISLKFDAAILVVEPGCCKANGDRSMPSRSPCLLANPGVVKQNVDPTGLMSKLLHAIGPLKSHNSPRNTIDQAIQRTHVSPQHDPCALNHLPKTQDWH